MRYGLMLLTLNLLLFTYLPQAQAFGPQLTYHGRILDSLNGNAPVTANNVKFLIQVIHPTVPGCVLYQETQVQNLSATDGNFTLTINGATSNIPAPLSSPFENIFAASPSTVINCIGGGVAGGTKESRKLNVFFIPPGGSGNYEPLPAQTINYVPTAIEALNTASVGGFAVESLLRVVDISGGLPGVPYTVPALTLDLYQELDKTIKGTSTYYVTPLGTVANFSNPLAGEITGTQSATVLSKILGQPLTSAGGPLIGGEVIYYDGANWISKQGSGGTVQSITSTNSYLSITGGPPSNNVTINPLITLNVGTAANTVAAGNDPRIVGALSASTPLAGDVTGLVSTTVVALVGGRTANQVSTSVGDTIAATATNNVNTIVKRDGSGNINVNTVSSNNDSTRNLNLYNATNTFAAVLNAPSALAVSYTLTLPSVLPVNGFVLATNATGQLSWISPTTGNVTNVSATAPLASTGGQTPTISITRSSTTVDGYLAATDFVTFNNKVTAVSATSPILVGGTTQNPVLSLANSGVTSGTYTKVAVNSNGLVTSGTTLIAADIPNLDASKITTGTLPIARGGTGSGAVSGSAYLTTNAAGTAFNSTVCNTNEVPFYNGTNWICRLASSANSSATIVTRDANGDFTANNITTVQDITVQRNLRIQNAGANYIGLTTPIATPSYDIVLPGNSVVPIVGQVLSVVAASSATIMTTWVNALTDAIASGTIYIGNASGTAVPRLITGDATVSNVGILTLSDVGPGVVSGTQYTKVSVDGKGRVTSGGQLAASDITSAIGYTPVQSVSVSSPLALSGTAQNPIIGLNNSGVVSSTYGSANAVPIVSVDGYGRVTSVTTTVYQDATAALKGVVSIGNNITVAGGVISLTNQNVVSALGYTPFNQATVLAGDVTGLTSQTVVAFVGGKTSAQVSQSVSDTLAATSLNSSGTIVKRDANGDFTANNITTVQNMTVQQNLRIQNAGANYIGLTTPIATPSYDIVLPGNSTPPNVGQVLSVAAASPTNVMTTWVNALTDAIASGTIYIGNASGTAVPRLITGDATVSNVGILTLSDVGPGVVSGTQYTKVTVDGKGRVTSGSQLAASDVTTAIGYTPVQSVSSTTPITLGGTAQNPVIGLANSGVVSSTYGSANAVPIISVDVFGRITSLTTTVYQDATAALKGVVSIGNNITVAGGVISLTNQNVVSALGYTPFNQATVLAGDVTGLTSQTVVAFVGGKTSAQVSQSVSDTLAATSLNSSGTIVKRDANGDFTANNITTVQNMTVQQNLRIQNAGANYIGLTTPIATPSYDIVLPGNSTPPNVGQVLSVAAASPTNVMTTWVNALTDAIASGTIYIGNASGTAVPRLITGDATISNVGFLALSPVGPGVVSGTQYTKVTVDGKGRVTSGSQLAASDVTTAIGYTPVQSVSSTTPITLGGTAQNPVIGLANSGVVSSTYGSANAVPIVSVDNFGRVTSVATTVYQDAASGTKGIVSIGNNISVTSGVISLTNANIASALGYSPTQSISVTAGQIVNSGTALNPILGLATTGVVSAAYPKVYVDTFGRVTSGTTLSALDVTTGLGYTPVQIVSATAPITIGGTPQNPVFSLGLSGVVSATYGSSNAVPIVSVDGYGRVTSVTTTVYQDATAALKGVVSIGNNITVAGGVISLTNQNVVSALGYTPFNQATVLAGDVTGLTSQTVVAFVGGKTSAQVSQSVSDTLAATSLNSSGTIVKRDANGDFTANNITTVQNMTVQQNLRIQNAGANYIGLTTPIATPSYDIVLPGNSTPPNVGQVLSVAAASPTNVMTTWVNALTDVLAPGFVFVGNASGTATGRAITGDVSISNTGVVTLSGVGAGVTSGTQYTKVTVDGKGRVTSGGQLAASDVTSGLGYTPVETVSSTVPVTVGGTAQNPVIGLANSGVVSSTYGSANAVPIVSVDNFGRVTSVATTVYQDAASGTKGIVSIGNNITVAGGVISLTNANIASALGYAPTQSISVVAGQTVNSGTALNPIIGLATTGVVSAAYPKVYVDTFGRVTSGTTLSFLDVTTGLGYTPVQIVSSTAPITLGGTPQAPVIGMSNSGVVSANYGSSNAIPILSVDGFGRITSVTTTTYQDAASGTKGIVSIGSNITVAGGVISLTNPNVVSALGYTPFNQATSLSGDVTGLTSQTVVAFVGGKTSAQVSQSVSDTLAATSLNSSGTIVKRDANGNFTANNITTVQDMTVQRNLRIQNGMTNSIGIFTPLGTPNYDITLPDNTVVPTVGQVLSVATSTASTIQTTWITALSDILASGSILVGNASGTATPTALSGDATLSNTGVITLSSVGAGVTSGTQYTKVTVDGKGRVTSGGQLSSADVTTAIGYTPVQIVSATAPIFLGGTAQSPVIGLNTSGVTSGSYGSASAVPNFTVDSFGRLSAAGSTAYQDATAGLKGVVSIGNNITLTAGSISITNQNVVSALGYTPFNQATTLAGDVTGLTSQTVVAFVGGKTSAQVSQSVSDTLAATSLNSSGTIVKRDANGNFTANNITTVQNMTVQQNLRIQNGVANYIGLTTPVASPSYDIVLPDNSTAPNVGQVLAVASSSPSLITTTWVNSLTDLLASGTILVGNATNTATPRALSGDATLSNTGVLTLASTGVTSQSYGSVSTVPVLSIDSKGRITSASAVAYQDATGVAKGVVAVGNNITVTAGTISLTNTNVSSALGYIPVQSVSGTSGQTANTGTTLNPVIGLATTGVIAATYPKVTVDTFGRVTSGSNLSPSDVTTGLGYTPVQTVTVSAPIALGGTAQNPVIGLNNSGVAAGTYPKVTVDVFGRVTSGSIMNLADITTALGYTPVNRAGDTGMTGNFTITGGLLTVPTNGLVVGTNQLIASGNNIGMGISAPTARLHLASSTTTAGSAPLKLTSGTVMTTPEAGAIEFDGTSLFYTDFGGTRRQITTTTTAITTLNGLNNSIQNFAIGTAGVSFGIISAGSTHTFNMPLASTPTVVAGVISNADYTYFGSKVSSVSVTAGQTVNSGTALNPILGLATTGVVSAAYPKVYVDTFGRVTSGTTLSAADISTGLGYTPVQSVTVSAPIALGGTAQNPIIGLNNSGVTPGTYGSASAVPSFTVDAFGRMTLAGSSAYQDATGVSKGIVQVGPNITLTGGVISVSYTNVVSALGFTPVNLAGDTMTGQLNVPGNSFKIGTNQLIAASNNIGIGVTAPTARLHLVSGSAVAGSAPLKLTSGTVMTTPEAGAIEFDGTSLFYTDFTNVRRQLTTTTTAITTLNGLSNSIQNFAFGTAGVSFGVSSAGSTHTFNMPLASTPTVVAGVISNADYTYFGSKVSSVSVTAGQTVNSGTAINPILGLATTGVVSAGYAKVYVDTFGRVTSGTTLSSSDVTTGLGFTPVNRAGDTGMTGNFTITGGILTVPTNGLVVGTNQLIATGNNIGVGVTVPTARLNIVAGSAAAGSAPLKLTSGTVMTTPEAGAVEYDGSNMFFTDFGGTRRTIATTTNAITSLNGLTNQPIQTFAVGTAGVSFGVSSAGSTHTFNMPLASTPTVVAGVISNADYTYFSNKISTLGVTAGQVVNSGTAVAPILGLATTGVVSAGYAKVYVDTFGRVTSGTTLSSSDVTTGLGFTPVNKIGDTMTGRLNLPSNGLAVGTNQLVVSGTYVGVGTATPQVPIDIGAGTGARFLLYGSGGPTGYQSGMGANLGQVSNSMGFFVGKNANFSIDFANVSEAFPYPSGYTTRFTVLNDGTVGIGTPTPTTSSILDVSSTTFGILIPRMTTAQRAAIASPADGLQVYDVTLHQLHYYDSSAPGWRALSTSGTAFINGGNSFASTATLGTNNAQNLVIETNGVTRATITTSGTFTVSGQALAVSQTFPGTPSTAVTFDANNGNVMILNTTVGAATSQTVTVNNVQPGAAYTLVVRSSAAANSGQINLDCRSGGVNQPASYIPTNGNRSTISNATPALYKSIYTFIYDGSNCLVTWITGF